jgi:hypothetical protein
LGHPIKKKKGVGNPFLEEFFDFDKKKIRQEQQEDFFEEKKIAHVFETCPTP